MSPVDYGKVRAAGTVDFSTDKDRINFLANLAEKGSENPVIYGFTRKLLNGDVKGYPKVQSYDSIGEVRRIFEWVRDNVSYRNHVKNRDSYQSAERTLELRTGDCDQMSVLLASMLATVGYDVAYRIIAAKEDMPFHHIYVLVGMPKHNPSKWIALDATENTNTNAAPSDGLSGRTKFELGDEHNYARKRDFRIIFGED